jgi:serine phosphatase RsbU (regulator of sigma subunit)
MRENVSPGHHIVMITDGEVLQARSHGRQSEDLLEAMRMAARNGGTAEGPAGEIVVGTAAGPRMSVAVAEQVTDIAVLVRRQVLRRTFSMLALGVALATIVNLAISRYVTRPVGSIVEAVRRLKRGEAGAQVPVPSARDLAFLVDEFNAMSATLAEAEERRSAQLRKARRMQQNLLPSDLPAPGLTIATMHEPAEEVAGDFYQVCTGPAGDVVLCLADAAGHGVPAAMLASMVSVLLEDACQRSAEPAEMMGLLSSRLAAVTLDEDFATVILVAFGGARHRLAYASAGHEPCYLLGGGERIVVLEPTGPPAGIVRHADWGQQEHAWPAGSRLVLATDGIAEAVDRDGSAFGRERLRELLESGEGLEPAELTLRIRSALHEFCGEERQLDDLTLIVVDADPADA